MKRTRKKRPRKPVGAPPGTILSDPQSPRPVIRVLAYGPDQVKEETLDNPDQIVAYVGAFPVVWIDIDGLGDAKTITRIGEILHLHPLALEDATHTQQRAKVDEYDPHLFIVARMLAGQEQVETEQISFFLGKGFVATFQEGIPGDNFGPVRERIRKSAGRIRQLGADALFYALIDAVIDAYFPILERLGERLEVLEDEILERADRRSVSALYETKRDLITVRRAVWPLREAMNSLVRDENPFISSDTRLYLRDCYDHTVRVIDFVETYRELASDLMDLYLSCVSQRMNEIMKVLTIISTIFIPLTFITSVYGMNFDTSKSKWNMPELEWIFGYPYALALMAVVAVVMLIYFWRKGWLRDTPVRRASSPSDRGE